MITKPASATATEAMTKLTIIALLLALSSITWAKGGGHSGSSSKDSGGTHSVRGYTTKDGTYVAPHRATNPDGSKSNNWSQKGNVNPDTGKPGTKQ